MNIDEYMKKHFPGLYLEPPLFYNWNIGIRFELGNPREEDESIYMERVLKRAITLLQVLHQNNEEIFIVCPFDRHKKELHKKLNVFTPFFFSLGIDPRKQGEVNQYKENKDGTHIYGGFYFIVGNIISGPDFWVNTAEGPKPNLETVNGIQIAFTNELAMNPDEGLPKPVIQLEFQLNVPWLLS